MVVVGAMLVSPPVASQVLVAVAANFSAPMKVIAAEFERDTAHRVKLSFGSTGQFYTQIKNGAPYDVLLAADATTPARLEDDGIAVAGTRFTYAIGHLVLWSRDADMITNSADVLRADRFNKLALANPKLAPYGAAALETIERMGLRQALAPKMVQGQNIAQTFQFVASGNAQLGFVALSQVIAVDGFVAGSGWIVPADYHSPIKQDAVLLKAGQDNEVAKVLLSYLQTDKVKQLIESFGYQVPQ